MALSYPVDRYRTFFHPRRGWAVDDGGPSMEYLGERVKITGKPRYWAAVLFADLKVSLPASGGGSARRRQRRRQLAAVS
jgi:hypothetical protein